jgi:hypothetical protein
MVTSMAFTESTLGYFGGNVVLPNKWVLILFIIFKAIFSSTYFKIEVLLQLYQCCYFWNDWLHIITEQFLG